MLHHIWVNFRGLATSWSSIGHENHKRIFGVVELWAVATTEILFVLQQPPRRVQLRTMLRNPLHVGF